MDFRKGIPAPLLLVLLLLRAPTCSLLGGAAAGGPSPPPSGSLSVSFIDVGQGDGVLVQAGGTSHLIDAGRPEEGANVVDILRSRGVEELDGIVVLQIPQIHRTTNIGFHGYLPEGWTSAAEDWRRWRWEVMTEAGCAHRVTPG